MYFGHRLLLPEMNRNNTKGNDFLRSKIIDHFVTNFYFISPRSVPRRSFYTPHDQMLYNFIVLAFTLFEKEPATERGKEAALARDDCAF